MATGPVLTHTATSLIKLAMNNAFVPGSLLALAAGLLLQPAFADGAHEQLAGQSSLGQASRLLPAIPGDPAPRQYAPDREVDLLHLALDILPDFRQRTIAGQATLRFKPIAQPLAELRLDATDLTVTNLSATEKMLGWQVTRDKITVTFNPPIPIAREAAVTIRYRAQPADGLFFRTREMGYPPDEEQLWTQGEAVSARHWFPSCDAPNDKFTSEVTCRVPEGMVALSNGRKVSEEKSGGLVAFHWLQDKPHANYLIALVAGHFRKLEDRHGNIPLAFWTTPSDFPHASSSFQDTRDMLAFYERETGVPYPWARYDQVCVSDFVVGGMENTTLTVLKNDTLFTAATENLRNSQGLVAHELAHQWFGDLVTCKDWSHLWLNEGFATYYEHLYDAHKNGPDQFRYRLWAAARDIGNQTNDTLPIVRRNYPHPNTLFDWRAYGKGAWVLHMLRSELGPEMFHRGIQAFLERHRFANVVTADFSAALEEVSGRSLDQFFDQWVYHAGLPELEVDYAWNEPTKMARLTLRQTQPVTDQVLLFRFPLTVRFKSRAGTVDRRVTVTKPSEDFFFTLPQAPDIVRLDPEVAVLAKFRFPLPAAMIAAQMADETDVVGRLVAIEHLAGREDHEAVALLQQALNHDSFYAVRIEAADALRALHTDEALEALLASPHQSDARVRRAVVADLGKFYRPTAATELLRVVREEKNPDIVAEAILALDACPAPEARQLLLQHLESTSFRNSLAEAAVRALRARQDPAAAEPLLEVLQRREPEFTARALANGLDALAVLARGQPNRDAVRQYLARQTTHLNRTVRLGALAALGSLEDPRALPILEKFATAEKENRERKTAETAIAAIRSARRVPMELGELRQEVLDLQKQNRELRRDLEALRKQIGFSSAFGTNSPAPPAPLPR
jgi:aminopeptidase N